MHSSDEIAEQAEVVRISQYRRLLLDAAVERAQRLLMRGHARRRRRWRILPSGRARIAIAAGLPARQVGAKIILVVLGAAHKQVVSSAMPMLPPILRIRL